MMIDGIENEWNRPIDLLTPHVPEETLGMAHLGEDQRAVAVLVNCVNNDTQQQWTSLENNNFGYCLVITPLH